MSRFKRQDSRQVADFPAPATRLGYNPRLIRNYLGAKMTRLCFVLSIVLAEAFLAFPPVRTKAQTLSPSPGLPSETPTQLHPVTDTFEYERRDVMIPMRDGVKLHTVIILPMCR